MNYRELDQSMYHIGIVLNANINCTGMVYSRCQPYQYCTYTQIITIMNIKTLEHKHDNIINQVKIQCNQHLYNFNLIISSTLSQIPQFTPTQPMITNMSHG